MLNLVIPEPWLWALRWLLFLGPLLAVVILAARRRDSPRCLVGCLFAFLYGIAMIFVTHLIAMHFGWWRYGSDALMLYGLPVDILTGGAILFGPVPYLLFPNLRPLTTVLPIMLCLHGTLFQSLSPMVVAGPGWWFGVVFVFLIAHAPALYLARWTEHDQHLPLRATLLAGAYGVLAFGLLPSLIMVAMGGDWTFQSGAQLFLSLPVLAVAFIMGLSAVQMFVIHGQGTPIPLDHTKKLVTTGIYSYVSNPMQLCSALGWIAIGIMIGSLWVAMAAAMAWVFVAGLVRWHHRHDLLVRFPVGWPEYRANVPEWLPRWRPWSNTVATVRFDAGNTWHCRWIACLRRRHAVDLQIDAVATHKLSYREPDEGREFNGLAAIGKSMNRINFAWAMVGALILLLVLPVGYLSAMWQQYRTAGISNG